MSLVIPQELVDALRHQSNFSVGHYGIDCLLNIPTNLDALDQADAYVGAPQHFTFTQRYSRVWIEWKPDVHRLRKLGLIYEEGDLPIIAWLPQSPDVLLCSYIKVPIQYVPRQYKTDEFEIVENLIRGMHDSLVIGAFRIAPRRVQTFPTAVTPTGLTAVAQCPTDVLVSWLDQSAGLAGFMLERATSLTGNWEQVVVLDAGVLSYLDKGLLPEQQYYYRISSYAGGALSTPSAPVGVVTPALPLPTVPPPQVWSLVPPARFPDTAPH